MNAWMNRKIKSPLRPVPHKLILNSFSSSLTSKPKRMNNKHSNGNVIRSWYGRMFLPPNDALMLVPNDDINQYDNEFIKKTFKQIRDEQIDFLKLSTIAHQNHKYSTKTTIACSPTMQVYNHKKDDLCDQNSMYCWMKCMPFDYKACNSKGFNYHGTCTNSKGDIWTKGMCSDCSPKCVKTESPPSPDDDDRNNNSTNSFCNGFTTDMYMEGFVNRIADPKNACLVLFSESFLILNSYPKYIFRSHHCIFTWFFY